MPIDDDDHDGERYDHNGGRRHHHHVGRRAAPRRRSAAAGPRRAQAAPPLVVSRPARPRCSCGRSTDGRKDQLKWKWSKGPARRAGRSRQPGDTTTYTLCIYDSTGGVGHVRRRAHHRAERELGRQRTHGLAYKDGAGSQDGVQKVHLRTGADGKSAATDSRERAAHPMPAPLQPDRDLRPRARA
jgi:hypothetical protein